MFKIGSLAAALVLFVVPLTALAQDYNVEVIDAAPEADEISDELSAKLSERGFRVKKSATRTACEIWLCKELTIDPAFKPTQERLYPFSVGQLLGVIHFGRRGSDFRDQTISSGWYTLRFGLQPIDGNHEGTSPTRDFLLMVDAEQDEFPETWEADALNETSAEAAGSSHPAMICLQKAADSKELAIRHDEQHDWWILHVVAKGTDGKQTKDIPMDLVVAGYASE